jgi:hypothetical protein
MYQGARTRKETRGKVLYNSIALPKLYTRIHIASVSIAKVQYAQEYTGTHRNTQELKSGTF